MKEWKRHAAIVLAAGKGSRMKCDVPKQYLSLMVSLLGIPAAQA